MKIYTGWGYGKNKIDNIKRLNLGIMISSIDIDKKILIDKEIYFAIDNGAFQCWNRGYPFMENNFIRILELCFKNGVNPEFIVCPDIVAGGMKSFEFSLRWADRLVGCRNLYFAVQDGMNVSEVAGIIGDFYGIFIGGTKEWKWKTARSWIDMAHKNKKLCHIGRCGTLLALITAEELCADSVDSTNFIRHDSWDIIEKFRNGEQNLFT